MPYTDAQAEALNTDSIAAELDAHLSQLGLAHPDDVDTAMADFFYAKLEELGLM